MTQRNLNWVIGGQGVAWAGGMGRHTPTGAPLTYLVAMSLNDSRSAHTLTVCVGTCGALGRRQCRLMPRASTSGRQPTTVQAGAQRHGSPHRQPLSLSSRYDTSTGLARAAVRDARDTGVPLGLEDVPEAVQRATTTATPDREPALAGPLADAVTGHPVGLEGWQLLRLARGDQGVEVHDHPARRICSAGRGVPVPRSRLTPHNAVPVRGPLPLERPANPPAPTSRFRRRSTPTDLRADSWGAIKLYRHTGRSATRSGACRDQPFSQSSARAAELAPQQSHEREHGDRLPGRLSGQPRRRRRARRRAEYDRCIRLTRAG